MPPSPVLLPPPPHPPFPPAACRIWRSTLAAPPSLSPSPSYTCTPTLNLLSPPPCHLQDLEEDPELRQRINIYKDKEALALQQQRQAAAAAGGLPAGLQDDDMSEDDDDDGDLPQVRRLTGHVPPLLLLRPLPLCALPPSAPSLI